MTDGREDFLDYWDRMHQRTTRAVERVPLSHPDWSPGAGMFSFADLVRHLAATERFMFVEVALGRSSAYPGHGPELSDHWAGVRALRDRLHREARDLIRAQPPEWFGSRCATPEGGDIRVSKWLRAMLEHEAHHRGQLHLMLRLVGAEPPPLFGLSSEQLRDLSRSQRV